MYRIQIRNNRLLRSYYGCNWSINESGSRCSFLDAIALKYSGTLIIYDLYTVFDFIIKHKIKKYDLLAKILDQSFAVIFENENF